jgi:hypothetical protein
VSEYQSYDFVALDRPLTPREMRELRTLSKRAEITPTRFWNEYHWGDFKADPTKLVARYFDAFMHFTSWGTRRLMLRVPTKRVDAGDLRPYFVGEAARATLARDHLVVDLHSSLEERGDDEPARGMLDAITPVRSELMRGDLRGAYLGWLLAVQAGDLDDDAIEPPIPHGLGALTAPQKVLVEFLRIDDDLLAAAATASAPLADDTRAMRRWATALPGRMKDALLSRVIEEPDFMLGLELSRMFRSKTKSSSTQSRRRVSDLRASATSRSTARARRTLRRRR